MKAFVRPGDVNDIDKICTLLHTKMNPRIPLERWYNLMTYAWTDDKPDFGRVVESGNEVLGYCGMVYADRILGTGDNKRKERVVSMSSWYLDKSLRGQGLGRAMLVDCTSDSNLTYATLTNSRKPLHIQETIGFKVLEDHRYVWRRQADADSALQIISDVEAIKARVDKDQLKILEDMASLPLTPILMLAAGQQTLLLLSIKRKAAEVTWFDVMHVSDYEHFSAFAQLLADALLDRASCVLAADGRFVAGNPTTAIVEKLPVPRFYHSHRLEPSEVDNIYSELQLLDLKLD
ncbi:MAG: GNAT family N-acetyltransferase [Granulosicoccus sp.]|nr:GNAT family N-acetyltransferase [Granulosicoccus sp.]